MANEEHLARLKEAIEKKDITRWNEWRFGYQEVKPDLYMADLSHKDLHNADLSYGNLIGIDLRGAHLQGANLLGANLGEANLVGASLRGADLRYVNLIGAALENTNFSRAIIGWTLFTMVDLSKSRGLDLTKHVAPSSIDVDTIHKSQGKIPEIFLRSAGVPEYFIKYMRDLPGDAPPLYSCFISYSSNDKMFAEKLHADMQAKGVRCWFAPEDMKIGDKLRPRIDESIRMYDKLLLIISETAIASQWIEQEVETALAKEREQNRIVLFPIRLDDAVMRISTGWPALIRNTRLIGDFTKWKDHDSCKKAFDRLLRDLSAEGKRKDETAK
jgi:hypothetical protein